MGTSVATAADSSVPPRLIGVSRSPVAQTFATTVAIIALGLLSGIQIARSLGPSGRGEVAAALLWPGLLVYLGSIGLAQAVVVFAARANDTHGVSIVFSTASCLGLGLSVIALSLGALLLPVVLHNQAPDVVRASRLFLLSVPAGMLSGFAVATLQGRCNFPKLNALRLIVPGGYVAGLTLLSIAHSLTLINIVILQIVLSYATFLLGWVILERHGVSFSLQSVKFGVGKQLLSFGMKAYAGTLGSTLNQRLDQALLAAWFPAAQLGLYTVAVSTAGATDTIGFAFRTVASGKIAQKTSASEKQIELRQTLARFWPVLLGCTAFLAVLLPKLVPLVYGPSFRAAIVPAEVLLVAQIFYAGKNLLTSASEAFGDSWLGSKAELIGLALNCLLLIVLLPRLGILGAALASAFVYFVQFGVMAAGFAARSRAFLVAKKTC